MAMPNEEMSIANLPGSRTSHPGAGITTEEMKELCWLKTKIVVQISFTDGTNYGLRHIRRATRRQEPQSVNREVAAG
jgi:hypothetical protein